LSRHTYVFDNDFTVLDIVALNMGNAKLPEDGHGICVLHSFRDSQDAFLGSVQAQFPDLILTARVLVQALHKAAIYLQIFHRNMIDNPVGVITFAKMLYRKK